MKRVTLVLLVVAMLSLQACGGFFNIKDPGEISASNSVEVIQTVDGDTVTKYNGNTYSTEAMSKLTTLCYQNKAADRQAKAATISTLEGTERLMAVVHADTMAMIEAVWGKDTCQPGTNEFDATIAYYKEQGALKKSVVTALGGGVQTIARWGFGAYVGGKLVDGITKNTGDTHITASEGSNVDYSRVDSKQIVAGEDNVAENAVGAHGDATSAVEGEVPEELTEEWCNEQGLTLRESTGECITYEYKSNIENSRLTEEPTEE